MKIRNILLLALLISVVVPVAGQELNQIDANGLRQGKWTASYPNGVKRYEGQFKDGRCQGVFTYYDEKGRLKAINEFDDTGTKALNKTYASNGRLIASGYFLNQKKEGEWRYYAEGTGKLILTEEYDKGKLNGWSRMFNPDNERIAEETYFVEGEKEGECRQYFDNGLLMAQYAYHENELNGPAKTYYPNSMIKEEGDYLNGSKNGVWKTYNEDGDIIQTDMYGNPE